MKAQQTSRTAQTREKDIASNSIRENSDNPASPSSVSVPSAGAWLCKSWKILLGALIGTLVSNILCLPLWTDYDVIGFFRTPLNKEARMEITYSGPLTGAEAFSITSSSDPSLCTPTNYRYGRGAQLYTANLRINEAWKSYSLTLNAHRKGMLQIMLRGPLESNDCGKIYSIFSDYRNLRIGGKEIFSARKDVSFSKYFSYRIPVNANDTIKISFDARRHFFGADDFNLIDSENFWYIVTLSVSAFVIFYVLLWRILSSCKHRIAEDAIFLFIFFLLLAIPVSNISSAQSSTREARTLKQCPKVSLVLTEGTNYGKEYDDWFCDHLGGREWLIKLHDVVHRETQRIIQTPRALYMQDSGWMFSSRFSAGSGFVRPMVSALTEMRKFCELNHIKFYIMVVPRKESIYREELYGYGLDKRKMHAEDAIHECLRHLAEKQHVTYIYPWKELRDARKQAYTFFKLTHHWTDWGAYIGYRALMKEVRHDFPNMPVVSMREYRLTRSRLIRDEWDRSFHRGWLRKFFNFDVDRRHPSTMYNYYEHKKADTLAFRMGDFVKDFLYRGGVYKIMLLGDSQCENLMAYLPYSAIQTRFIRLNANHNLPVSEQWRIMKYYSKDILSYKPDIVILSLSELVLRQIQLEK